MDLLEIAMMGYGLLSLGIAIVVIAWPIESERRFRAPRRMPASDAFVASVQHRALYERDSNYHSARPATFADQGSGGNGNASQGVAAARFLYSNTARHLYSSSEPPLISDTGSERHAR